MHVLLDYEPCYGEVLVFFACPCHGVQGAPQSPVQKPAHDARRDIVLVTWLLLSPKLNINKLARPHGALNFHVADRHSVEEYATKAQQPGAPHRTPEFD